MSALASTPSDEKVNQAQKCSLNRCDKWKGSGRLLSQPTLRERRNGRHVVDCGEKGRVATDITSYSRQLYRLKNQHDIVIMCNMIIGSERLC